MAQRWSLVKKRLQGEDEKTKHAATQFEKTNLTANWKWFCYDAAGRPGIAPTSQSIESYHFSIQNQTGIDTNRVVTAKVIPSSIGDFKNELPLFNIKFFLSNCL